ncbi:MAG: beta-ketoacyl-ACP synthase III [Elusimicrobiota bacterium]
MKKARITGTGSYLPEKVLTNRDLENMVNTNDEWIVKRTGIKERRIASDKEASSDMGAKAALRAVEAADIDIQDIDLIICATITPDMVFPATACLIQQKLGIKESAAFDVEAACTGFITALSVAEGMLAGGNYKNALVVASEVLSRITDWSDRSTCVLFGDGAGAAVLSPSDSSETGILSSHLGASGRYSSLLKLPAGGSLMPASEDTLEKKLHYMKMEGNKVFKIAVAKMAESSAESLKRASLTCEDLKIIVPHQANLRIIKSLAKKLKVKMDKVYVNISRYGNMSAATTAVGLDEIISKGLAGSGDAVQLVAFGGGLTWGSLILRI